MKIAAVYQDSENFRSFREGNTVRTMTTTAW